MFVSLLESLKGSDKLEEETVLEEKRRHLAREKDEWYLRKHFAIQRREEEEEAGCVVEEVGAPLTLVMAFASLHSRAPLVMPYSQVTPLDSATDPVFSCYNFAVYYRGRHSHSLVRNPNLCACALLARFEFVTGCLTNFESFRYFVNYRFYYQNFLK